MDERGVCEICGDTAAFLVPGIAYESDTRLCTKHAESAGFAVPAFEIVEVEQ
jgi:hypothetical protein